MRVATVILCALLLAPAAVAAPPAGFRDSPALDRRAEAILGKPVEVYCATSVTAWDAYLASRGIRLTEGFRVDGLTRRGTGVTLLAPWVCATLEGWLRGARVPNRYLGERMLSFVHEVMHLRGITGESEADCTALRELPTIARRHFGIRQRMLRVMSAAWSAHRARPAEYRQLC